VDATGRPRKCNFEEYENRDNPGFDCESSFPTHHWDRSREEWWDADKIITMRMLLDGEDAGLMSWQLCVREKGPHMHIHCLYAINVTVNSEPKFRGQRLAQYTLWYAHQLVLYINKYTTIGTDTRGPGLIRRVFFVTKRGNVAMHKIAEKCGMRTVRVLGTIYPVNYTSCVPLPDAQYLEPGTFEGCECIYTNRHFQPGAASGRHSVLVHSSPLVPPPASTNLNMVYDHTLATGCVVSESERRALKRVERPVVVRAPSMESQTLGQDNSQDNRHYSAAQYIYIYIYV